MNTQHSELSSLIIDLVTHQSRTSTEEATRHGDPILQGATTRLIGAGLAGLLVWMPLMTRLTNATDTIFYAGPSLELPRSFGSARNPQPPEGIET